MKSRLILTIALLLPVLVACGGGQDPDAELKAALVESVKEVNPTLETFSISEVSVESEVLFKEELARRIALMTTKAKVESKKGRLQELTKTNSILEALRAYESEHAAQADSVIYSVVRFKGSGKTSDGAKVPETEMIATVTQGSHVYSIQPAGGNPYKGMGEALPGYLDILKSAE